MDEKGELNKKLAKALLIDKSIATAQALLEAGADPGYINMEGSYKGSLLQTAVTYSYQSYFREMAIVLLDHGANINEIDSHFKYSILMTAIENKSYEFARYLIDHGADYNYVINNEGDFKNGWTALRWLEAGEENQESKSLIDYLKSKGASTGFVDMW